MLWMAEMGSLGTNTSALIDAICLWIKRNYNSSHFWECVQDLRGNSTTCEITVTASCRASNLSHRGLPRVLQTKSGKGQTHFICEIWVMFKPKINILWKYCFFLSYNPTIKWRNHSLSVCLHPFLSSMSCPINLKLHMCIESCHRQKLTNALSHLPTACAHFV